eukprot:7080888-Prymnesium_polylepis.1
MLRATGSASGADLDNACAQSAEAGREAEVDLTAAYDAALAAPQRLGSESYLDDASTFAGVHEGQAAA